VTTAARAAVARLAGAAVSADPGPSAPVIVLAPAYSGASRVRSLLEGRPDLACTSGTGMLPLCEQALATWQSVDRRPSGQPSSLATTSTRAMTASVMIAILAREGKRRWCEVAAANPRAAEAFLRLYPETRFLCLYRACPGVIRAVLDASPWGITDLTFAPFTSKYPANTAAALTAYWITATAPLLDFEREHPQACLRVRFEDLAEGRDTEDRITSFLGLADAVPQPTLDGLSGTVFQSPPGIEQLSPDTESAADLPADLIPPALLAQANDLLRKLDYPLIGAG